MIALRYAANAVISLSLLTASPAQVRLDDASVQRQLIDTVTGREATHLQRNTSERLRIGASVSAADQPPPTGCRLLGQAVSIDPPNDTLVSSFPPLQLDVRTPLEPTVLASGGRSYLIYELHLRNFTSDALQLRSIEVLNAESALEKPVVAFQEEQLRELVRLVGVDSEATRLTLKAGQGAVAFLCLAFAGGTSVPTKLRHRVFSSGAVAEGPTIGTRSTRIQALGRPLAGTNWTAANGPSLDSHHRMGLFVAGGLAQISRRYALDWKKYRDGKSYSGDARDVNAYFAYGQTVLAVADGKVVVARDGFPNNVPRTAAGFTPAVPVTMESLPGNFIVIDLGDGQFAQYAHLQPGSVQVKVGDRVQRGQSLARIGNSGDAREPHLHFQVATSPDILASEGLPFLFDHYRLSVSGAHWETRTMDFPMGSGVIDFGALR